MPLYAVLRREGYPESEAMDLVQGFLVRLLEKRDVAGADRERGLFRTYLLGALKHFVQNERRDAKAQKRGGGVDMLSLDAEAAEGRYRAEAVDDTTPEQVFDRQFALALLDRVMESLATEYRDRGRGEAFDKLKCYLVERPEAGDYVRLAEELDAEEGAIKVTVHRMRKRLRTLMTAEIADTVADPLGVTDEFAHLLAALVG